MITICLTYFKSLTLANLAAALYSVRRQDLTRVREIIVLDNDTADTVEAIQAVVEEQKFPVPVQLITLKHRNPSFTHAWSTNNAVRFVQTSWVFFTRADYLLDFSILSKFVAVVDWKPSNWNGFIVSGGCHLGNNVAECESLGWRQNGMKVLHGTNYDHTEIDSGVWMARREAFENVGGLDEDLSAWGHAQTEFQYRMFTSGVEFVRLGEVLFYHTLHAAQRDLGVANQQLQDKGIDIRKLWERYDGPRMY